MFIIEYLYNRFPRFKQHHDTVYKIWRQLPTDVILEDQYKRSLVDRVSVSSVYSYSTENKVSVSRLLSINCVGFTLTEVDPMASSPLQ